MLSPALPTFLLLTLTPLPTFTLDTFNLKPNSSLPYRPISTNRVGTISFTTNSAKVIKTFNLESHTKYFKDIVGLWGSIFIEEQLVSNRPSPEQGNYIDKQNPECRDLRSIVMEELKSVSDLLHANVYIFDDHPIQLHKRSVRSTKLTSRVLYSGKIGKIQFPKILSQAQPYNKNPRPTPDKTSKSRPTRKSRPLSTSDRSSSLIIPLSF